jgi:hypothetical protein
MNTQIIRLCIQAKNLSNKRDSEHHHHHHLPFLLLLSAIIIIIKFSRNKRNCIIIAQAPWDGNIGGSGQHVSRDADATGLPSAVLQKQVRSLGINFVVTLRLAVSYFAP